MHHDWHYRDYEVSNHIHEFVTVVCYLLFSFDASLVSNSCSCRFHDIALIVCSVTH